MPRPNCSGRPGRPRSWSRFRAPTAADALLFAVARVDAGEFVDLALLDGHYLRRSDAEIFGEKLPAEPQGA